MLLLKNILEKSKENQENIAIDDGVISLTYSDLLRCVKRNAKNITPDKRIGIKSCKSIDWIINILAIWTQNSTAVVIPEILSKEEKTAILEQEKVLFCIGHKYESISDFKTDEILRIPEFNSKFYEKDFINIEPYLEDIYIWNDLPENIFVIKQIISVLYSSKTIMIAEEIFEQ